MIWLQGGIAQIKKNGRISHDPAVIFNKDIALEVGGYDPEFTMGDVPLWLRMLDGRKGWEIAEPLYLYRYRPYSFSHTHREGIAVRAKYSPESVDDYVSTYTGLKITDAKPNYVNYWMHDSFLEALSGKLDCSMIAAGHARELGGSLPAYLKAILRTLSINIFRSHYLKKYRTRYKYRPELEKQIRELHLWDMDDTY